MILTLLIVAAIAYGVGYFHRSEVIKKKMITNKFIKACSRSEANSVGKGHQSTAQEFYEKGAQMVKRQVKLDLDKQ